MYTIESKPRLNVEISSEHKRLLDKHLGEWGRKKEVMGVILTDLFRLFEKHGTNVVIGALVHRAISLKEICKLDIGDANEGKES